MRVTGMKLGSRLGNCWTANKSSRKAVFRTVRIVFMANGDGSYFFREDVERMAVPTSDMLLSGNLLRSLRCKYRARRTTLLPRKVGLGGSCE